MNMTYKEIYFFYVIIKSRVEKIKKKIFPL